MDCFISSAPALHVCGGRAAAGRVDALHFAAHAHGYFPGHQHPGGQHHLEYTGLDAQQVEQRVVYVNERTFTVTVNNIEHIESTSYNGIGVIKVFLQPGASVDSAVAQITAVGQTVLKQMPPGMTPPLIIQYNASTVPILQYSFSSPKLSEQELFDATANHVRIGLANVPGAMIPSPYGGKQRVIAVDLSLPALKAKNIQAQDVVNAISAQNLVLPSGTAKIGPTEYAVAVDANARLIDDLNHLPIKIVNGATIYLSDVAQVHDGYTPQQNAVRQDGVRGALLTIMKSGNASTLDVVTGVKAALPLAMASAPPDLQVKEFADQSLFVRAAISGVLKEGVIAASLTAADDFAVSRLMAQHVHHRVVHSAGRALFHRGVERAGGDHQFDDAGRSGAGGGNFGGRRHRHHRKHPPAHGFGPAVGGRDAPRLAGNRAARVGVRRSAFASCLCRCFF